MLVVLCWICGYILTILSTREFLSDPRQGCWSKIWLLEPRVLQAEVLNYERMTLQTPTCFTKWICSNSATECMCICVHIMYILHVKKKENMSLSRHLWYIWRLQIAHLCRSCHLPSWNPCLNATEKYRYPLATGASQKSSAALKNSSRTMCPGNSPKKNSRRHSRVAMRKKW